MIFDIQRYTVHDGPGIRTTVFLKGCPLDCWWCHNPEGKVAQPQIAFLPSRCVQCGNCREVCPQLRQQLVASIGTTGSNADGSLDYAPLEQCLVCGKCVEICPAGARSIVGKQVTAEQLVEELLKDRLFYDQSGGGVTFSGGEPLTQPEFLEQVLTLCKKHGLHTAVDTCGYCSWEALAAVVPLTDLFLYDIKCMSDDLHCRTTGRSNKTIISNLLRLDEIAKEIWLRVPLVPGLNDTAHELTQIAGFAARLKAVSAIWLLPYHRLGNYKIVFPSRRALSGSQEHGSHKLPHCHIRREMPPLRIVPNEAASILHSSGKHVAIG